MTSNLGLPLFNAAESRRQRDRGMAIAASYPNDEWLAKARSVAELLAAKYGEVTSDQVLAVCPRPMDVRPNVTGSIFKGKQWKCIGFINSAQVSRHAGAIRRWVLKT